MTRETGKIKIILIAGYGRSGSTLLDRILGNSLNACSVGELRHIWDRGFLEDQLCGCGKKFSECPFWRSAISNWSRTVNKLETSQIMNLKQKVDRMREIPRLLFPKMRPQETQTAYQTYSQIIFNLYKSIQKESECDFIVDSSKDASYAYLLNSMAEQGLIDLFVIHLVRDSRAVAYSWQRQKKRPEIHWKEENMPIHSVSKSALEWGVSNSLMSMFRLFSAPRYFFLKYEDFVIAPDHSLQKIYQFLKVEREDIRLPDEKQMIELKPAHTISGNPMRFQQGNIRIQPDNEWMNKLPQKQKWLTTFLSLPLLILYRYI